jgi:signal transduction histidine kinase
MLKVKATLLAELAMTHVATSSASREDILESASAILCRHGAQRVRYYLLAKESIPQLARHETLFLNWHSYASEDSAPDPGFRIPLRKATIFASLGRRLTNPVIGSGERFPTDPVVMALDLRDRSWVHILVEDNTGRRLGVLSADWEGSARPLSAQQSDYLMSFGRILGSQLAGTQPAIDRRLQDSLAKLSPARGSVDELLRSAVELLGEACDIASLSLFKFEWTTGRLTRSWMIGPRGLINGLPSESYRVGEFLTGRAFEDDRYRYVLDFENLREHASELLNRESVDAHEAALSRIYTIAYAVLGVREPRYLVRAINHSKNSTMPFVVARRIMTRYAQALSPYLETRISFDRSKFARDVTLRVASGEPPALLTKKVADELGRSENIAKMAIIIGRKRGASVRPDFIWPLEQSTSSRYEHARRFLNRHANEELSRGDLRIWRRQDERHGSFLLDLVSRDDQNIGCYYFGAGATVGWLIFPVSRQIRTGLAQNGVVPQAAATYLLQLCDLISQSHEQAFSRWQTQGALNALSLVGHEMTEPMAAINQIAQTAVDIAASAVTNPQTERLASAPIDRSELMNMMDRLKRHLGFLESAVRLGNLVGRGFGGGLRGTWERTVVASVLNFAVTRVNREIAGGILDPGVEGIRIGKPTGDRMAAIVCDRYLVEAAVVNLLRNAVKYSTEAPKLPVVDIAVTRVAQGEQSHFDISVSNTAGYIPPEYRQSLLDPFTRFTDDPDSARKRGMGLGLHLVNEIAEVHHGAVIISQSRESSNQPAVYRTTFTIRIAGDLTPGLYPMSMRKISQ